MKAVLFDLDGTLLDIDLQSFLAHYFQGLGPVVAEVVGSTADDGLAAVLDATQAMMAPHPGVTNRDVFAARFEESTAVALEPHHWQSFDRFYEEQFPAFGAGHGPRSGGLEAIEVARTLGLAVALATNPIFPLVAIRERMRWADVDAVDFDLITSYENMTACKPHAAYYLEVASMLGVPPSDCIMVGDDRSLDMAAADVGMLTYYCGPEDGAFADFRGDLEGFTEVLRRIA